MPRAPIRQHAQTSAPDTPGTAPSRSFSPSPGTAPSPTSLSSAAAAATGVTATGVTATAVLAVTATGVTAAGVTDVTVAKERESEREGAVPEGADAMLIPVPASFPISHIAPTSQLPISGATLSIRTPSLAGSEPAHPHTASAPPRAPSAPPPFVAVRASLAIARARLCELVGRHLVLKELAPAFAVERYSDGGYGWRLQKALRSLEPLLLTLLALLLTLL
ncbi:hypothetical protein T492DRAFT_910412 [Pavlovales sp. CCMP2436]|nr:hypothetical protein T492DRAFT_910412 [Pavlovales sp. CCMP2436]